MQKVFFAFIKILLSDLRNDLALLRFILSLVCNYLNLFKIKVGHVRLWSLEVTVVHSLGLYKASIS